MKLRLALLVICAVPVAALRAADLPLPTGATLVQEVKWPTVLPPELKVSPQDPAILVATGASPRSIPLWSTAQPGVTSKTYALLGEVRYHEIRGNAWLDMWSQFPGAPPGSPPSRYFSRTLAEVGPMRRMTGDSDWREIIVPFDGTGSPTPVSAIDLNLAVISPVGETVPGGGGVVQRESDRKTAEKELSALIARQKRWIDFTPEELTADLAGTDEAARKLYGQLKDWKARYNDNSRTTTDDQRAKEEKEFRRIRDEINRLSLARREALEADIKAREAGMPEERAPLQTLLPASPSVVELRNFRLVQFIDAKAMWAAVGVSPPPSTEAAKPDAAVAGASATNRESTLAAFLAGVILAGMAAAIITWRARSRARAEHRRMRAMDTSR